jgi:hypothetical protein
MLGVWQNTIAVLSVKTKNKNGEFYVQNLSTMVTTNFKLATKNISRSTFSNLFENVTWGTESEIMNFTSLEVDNQLH